MMNNCPCPPVNAANKSKGKIQSRRGERAEPVRESLDSPVDSSSPLRIKPRSIKDQTHPAPEPHAFGKDLTRQARHPEKKKVFKQLSVPYKTPSGKKRERERVGEQETPHSAAQVGWRRERSTPYLLVGVVVGVGAGGGIGSGAGADKDLEAAVLGPRHGAG
jgi:hypothetical protein